MPEIAAPQVFISYSHDSDQHKDWVRELAGRLRADGADVVLDQWEIGPGHDVTVFMEHGLKSSDWVLIVCTEEYIRKANTLKGGVGYERMIVTAEVARNLETKKFIPIIRGENSDRLPTFLGARIYVDLRGNKLNVAEYDRLLRSLHGAPKYAKPAIGPNPYATGKKTAIGGDGTSARRMIDAVSGAVADILGETTMEPAAESTYHWHRAVHEYCGNTLYLILLRFNKGSIFLKESILNNLRDSRITDFKIFHLYAPWDILIRAWADEDSFKRLKNNFAENRDINSEKTPTYLAVEHLQHLSEEGVYADAKVAEKILREVSLSQLEKVQDGEERGQFFEYLKEQGVLLDERIRFDPDRIQFYITLSSPRQLDVATKARIQRLISRECEGIFNRSVYLTPGASIQAVLKAQADGYYSIHQFLRMITDELVGAGEDITTETMLVANCEPRDSKIIDFKKAESYIVDNAFKQLVPENSALDLPERWRLQSLFAGVWPNLHEDNRSVLSGLIRAKAAGSSEEIGTALSTFFAPFESRSKASLVPILVAKYGNDWQEALDKLKDKEKIEAKTWQKFSIGDLCKVYKRIVIEKNVIDIAPLTEEEFAAVMDAVASKRNVFSHVGPAEVLKQWDDWFSLCSKFVPIHHRLMKHFDALPDKK